MLSEESSQLLFDLYRMVLNEHNIPFFEEAWKAHVARYPMDKTLSPEAQALSPETQALAALWSMITRQENSQIYITITNKPIWDNQGKYSYYGPNIESHVGTTGSYTEDFHKTSNLLKHLGIKYTVDNTYLLVDNSLTSKPTKFNDLSVYAPNHLVMGSSKFCGILNVGTYSDGLIC